MKNRGRGFTLLELMIVLAILGVIAAIAVPSFIDSVRKARRSDGGDALLFVQQLQEKYWASNGEFGTLLEIGYPKGGDAQVFSTEGYYQITTTGDGSVTSYTVTAANPRGVRAPATCWRN